MLLQFTYLSPLRAWMKHSTPLKCTISKNPSVPSANLEANGCHDKISAQGIKLSLARFPEQWQLPTLVAFIYWPQLLAAFAAFSMPTLEVSYAAFFSSYSSHTEKYWIYKKIRIIQLAKSFRILQMKINVFGFFFFHSKYSEIIDNDKNHKGKMQIMATGQCHWTLSLRYVYKINANSPSLTHIFHCFFNLPGTQPTLTTSSMTRNYGCVISVVTISQ